MATYTFIALDNCSPNNMVQSSSSHYAVVSRPGCKAVICSHNVVIRLLSGCHEAIIKQSFFKDFKPNAGIAITQKVLNIV